MLQTSVSSSPELFLLQQKLIQKAVEQNVLKFGDFTLKSGRKSPYFFNAGLFNDGMALGLLAQNYAAVLKAALAASQAADTVIFGPAYKGIPLVAATAYALQEKYHLNVPWAFNRKEAKDHGEGGVLVGAPVAGQKVWIIDDVITAGTAVREVIELLEKSGAKIAGVLVALDRQEKGAGELSAIQELQKAYDIPVHAIMTLKDIMSYALTQGLQEDYERMKLYQETYGITI